MSTSELRADGLGLDLGGRAVLDDVALTVGAGASLAISGPSGSGKTVLLLLLAGLMAPTRGVVLVDGGPIDRDASRSRFGVILQTQGLVPELTAEENVALPLQQRRLDSDDVARRCREALTSVGLDKVSDRPTGELSGGQRQRVGVARALAGSPEILIADEPTAELDPDNRSRILSLLLESSPARIVVVASNDPEVSGLCRQMRHLRDGRLDAGE